MSDEKIGTVHAVDIIATECSLDFESTKAARFDYHGGDNFHFTPDQLREIATMVEEHESSSEYDEFFEALEREYVVERKDYDAAFFGDGGWGSSGPNLQSAIDIADEQDVEISCLWPSHNPGDDTELDYYISVK